MTYQLGDTILDKYRIEELIGRGACGDVYRTTHLALNDPRALKVLRKDAPGMGSTEFSDYQARFRLEAQLGAKLGDHPNIVRVHDFEQDDDTLILVMEYIPGGSLTDKLDQVDEPDKQIPIDEAVKIAIDVAHGLSAIHALDVVHRDLKPNNILFDRQGRAKVADLGLVQIYGGLSMRSRLSSGISHPGTAVYMSPEQKQTSDYLTSASDIYALGLVLFKMLTGRMYVFQRKGTRAAVLREDVPGWLDDLLAQMLAEKPEDRPWDGEGAGVFLQEKGLKEEQKVDKVQQKNPENEPEVEIDALAAEAKVVMGDHRINEKGEVSERESRKAESEDIYGRLQEQQKAKTDALALEAKIKGLVQKAQDYLRTKQWDHVNRVIVELVQLGDKGLLEANKLKIQLQKEREAEQSDISKESLAKVDRLFGQALDDLKGKRWVYVANTIRQLDNYGDAGKEKAAILEDMLAKGKAGVNAAPSEKELANQFGDKFDQGEQRHQAIKVKTLVNEAQIGVSKRSWKQVWDVILKLEQLGNQGRNQADLLRNKLSANQINSKAEAAAQELIDPLVENAQEDIKNQHWEKVKRSIVELVKLGDNGLHEAKKIKRQLDKELKAEPSQKVKNRVATLSIVEIDEIEKQARDGINNLQWDYAFNIRSLLNELGEYGASRASELDELLYQSHTGSREIEAEAEISIEIKMFSIVAEKKIDAREWNEALKIIDQLEDIGDKGFDAALVLHSKLARERENAEQKLNQETTHRTENSARRLPWRSGMGLLIVFGIAFAGIMRGYVFGRPNEKSILPSFNITDEWVDSDVLMPSSTEKVMQSTPGTTPSTSVPTLLTTRTPLPTLGPGPTQISQLDSMVQVNIPAGEFEMGSDSGNSDERPAHSVILDAFWMDQTEITFGQFTKFTQDENYSGNPCSDGWDYPVACVSWFDAQAYCEWAGRRLPTEAEWERAARGGLEGATYPWGNDAPVCQFEELNGAQSDLCGEKMVPVGSFAPNSFGIYDTAGNVMEWVTDWLGSYSSSQSRNPKGPVSGDFRVLRGGSFHSDGGIMYTYGRYRSEPDGKYNNAGFRCAMDAEQ
jgi:formylglycine-generating enzyme required for sulfatase activity/serine/threonine protein kinase